MDGPPSSTGRAELELEVPVRGRVVPARRTARCLCEFVERRDTSDGARLVFAYAPLTPRSAYMLHQYFLRSSLAGPRRELSLADPQPAPRIAPRKAAGTPAVQKTETVTDCVTVEPSSSVTASVATYAPAADR